MAAYAASGPAQAAVWWRKLVWGWRALIIHQGITPGNMFRGIYDLK